MGTSFQQDTHTRRVPRLWGHGEVLGGLLLPLVVSQGDALRGDFEVDDRGGGRGVGHQRLGDSLGDGLGARERLHLHRVDEEDVAGWKRRSRRGVSHLPGPHSPRCSLSLLTRTLFEKVCGRVAGGCGVFLFLHGI